MPLDSLFPFDNSYARLPERFFSSLPPTPVSSPTLIKLNQPLALQLGLDPELLQAPQGVDVFAGNQVPGGAEPLAMAYAGFQFGGWVPQLGDGRAILLGELLDTSGVRHDIQLKGAGRTPFSRGGDGRAALGPILREYIVSEAMARLGIATTRSLAAVTTGDQVARETMLPGAILTRVAKSHVRVGTFQFFAARRDIPALRALADYVIDRHYPEATQSERPYLELLASVIRRQAELIASWQMVGFIHGVMNTDNTSIVGETIDYGPCAFMDTFHPDQVFSAIDHGGRYAYKNQPPIAHWNLSGLAQTLLPLIDDHEKTAIGLASEALETFRGQFDALYLAGMRRKLGLTEEHAEDDALLQGLLTCMAKNQADFTLTFRGLCAASDPTTTGSQDVGALFAKPEEFAAWAESWHKRLATEAISPSDRQTLMRSVNPAFIPRNHRIEEVIQAATRCNDLAPFHQLVEVLGAPFDEQPHNARFRAPPATDEVVHQTFCGT